MHFVWQDRSKGRSGVVALSAKFELRTMAAAGIDRATDNKGAGFSGMPHNCADHGKAEAAIARGAGAPKPVRVALAGI